MTFGIMDEKDNTTLNYFLSFTHGLKKVVSSYEVETSDCAIFFYFKYNQKSYGIWFAYNCIEIGVKTSSGDLFNCRDYKYNDNEYMGESETNFELDIEKGCENFDYIGFLNDLEVKTSNWGVT